MMMKETITNSQWVPPVAAAMKEVPPVAAAMEEVWVLLDIEQ